MLIQDLFQRTISRQINGVVKADEVDASAVWQELDEFVVTRELDKHLRKFFSEYVHAVKHPGTHATAEKMGVWVSGFFGSGKSHFIKVLSYLLANREHRHDGEAKRAVEFFENKIEDATLLADVKTAVTADTDVILFNIDSKADLSKGRDAILQVFLRVFNEMRGYSPDHPHIAHLERYLDSNGKLTAFHDAFREVTGKEWANERDAYALRRDEVIAALGSTLGQSMESAAIWIDNAEDNFSLTVENFCRWVREYLDARGPQHRIIFLADEVGQFIGTDTHLMLNLQTITEELGTICRGRAWIVVTSQEDVDALLGNIQGSKANDFSKIQGRFRTRLSLSSSNADEVIQQRLLKKRDDVRGELKAIFAEKGDVLRHQLTFTNIGMTLKPFKDADEFVKDYPFVPYQFKLVQKIFEAIRTVGATGLHLSRGERSMLDAFHSAAQQLAQREVGALVPLYRFYPSIESFLDTAVKRTIDQSATNPSLVQPIDRQLLETLFLIRYVNEMRGNVENLVTLFIDEIDADRVALKRTIEEGLQRLEKETLISRNGDNYFFLTNEERDIGREIKNVELGSREDSRELGTIIFEEVLKGQTKYRYSPNKMDFGLTRLCDDYVSGRKVDGGLVVAVVSPLADNYDEYEPARCIMDSNRDGGQLLVRLGNDERLGRELRIYLQTEKYLRTRNDGTLPESTRKIHRDLADQNRQRRERLVALVGAMLAEADYFAVGAALSIKATAPMAAIEEGLDYLVRNSFPKMSYLKRLASDPEREIQAVLRSNDIDQQRLILDTPEANPDAIEELRQHIDRLTRSSRQIVLRELVEEYFARRPFGWPEMEVLLLVARLMVIGEIQLVADGAVIPTTKAYETLTTPAKQRRATIVQNRLSDPAALKSARMLGREIFSDIGPEGEEGLVAFLRGRLEEWDRELATYRSLADTGNYPGGQESADGLALVKALLAPTENFKFIERFNERHDDLITLAEQYRDLQHFHQHQKTAWDRLRREYERFSRNALQLDRNEAARRALGTMRTILNAPAPYALIRQSAELIETVEAVNHELIERARATAVAAIDGYGARLRSELEIAGAGEALSATILRELESLRDIAGREDSLAHIAHLQPAAEEAYDAALERITASVSPPVSSGDASAEPSSPPKPRRVLRPAELAGTTYIETVEEAQAFIEALRARLEEMIARGERIEIR